MLIVEVDDWDGLRRNLARDWWLIVLRAVVALALGVAAFAWTDMTLVFLMVLFAVYCLLDGIALVAVGWRHRDRRDRWWLVLLQGIVSLVAGGLILVMPEAGALALLILIAFWALVTGAMEIAAAIHMRRLIEGEWLLILGGVLSMVLGVLLVLFPHAGITAYVWLIGLFSLLYGAAMAVLAYRLRRYRA